MFCQDWLTFLEYIPGNFVFCSPDLNVHYINEIWLKKLTGNWYLTYKTVSHTVYIEIYVGILTCLKEMLE